MQSLSYGVHPGVIHPHYCKYHLLKVQEGSDPRAHSAKEPAARELRSRTPRSRTAALVVYNAAANASKMSVQHGLDVFHICSLAMVFRIVFRGGRRPPRINSASSAYEASGTRPNTSHSGPLLLSVDISSMRRLSRFCDNRRAWYLLVASATCRLRLRRDLDLPALRNACRAEEVHVQWWSEGYHLVDPCGGAGVGNEAGMDER